MPRLIKTMVAPSDKNWPAQIQLYNIGFEIAIGRYLHPIVLLSHYGFSKAVLTNITGLPTPAPASLAGENKVFTPSSLTFLTFLYTPFATPAPHALAASQIGHIWFLPAAPAMVALFFIKLTDTRRWSNRVSFFHLYTSLVDTLPYDYTIFLYLGSASTKIF